GLGHFVFRPRAGHRYRSTIRLSDGTAISTLLPAAFAEGTVMHVSPDGDDRYRVDVRSTNSDAFVYLLADTRRSVRVARAAQLRSGSASFVIDKARLGEGISHLTIFDQNRQPVCERLVFRNPSQPLQLAVKPDQPSYGTRKKINLTVSSTSDGIQAMPADCSVAVYRVDSLQEPTSGGIYYYLWLASDLKGRIESPAYYFEHPGDRDALDDLLLTHGWRRFRWEEVTAAKSAAFDYPLEYHGAIVTGRMLDAATNNPATQDVQGYLSVPGTRTQFTSATSDSKGRIRFELKDFYGAPEIIVQTNPEDSASRIEINNPFSEKYTESPLPSFQLARGDSGTVMDR